MLFIQVFPTPRVQCTVCGVPVWGDLIGISLATGNKSLGNQAAYRLLLCLTAYFAATCLREIDAGLQHDYNYRASKASRSKIEQEFEWYIYLKVDELHNCVEKQTIYD